MVDNEEADILRAIEEENLARGEVIAYSNLRRSTCRDCGAEALSTPEHVVDARCGACLQSRAGAGITAYAGPYTVPVGYPFVGTEPAVSERAEHPAPLVSSRDATSAEVIPDPVTDLRDIAFEHGWMARVQHAHGNRVNGSTGRPTALVPSFAVRIGDHPNGSGARAFAVYSGVATWSWISVWVFGPALKPFGHCNITDLKQWLAQGANVQLRWYSDVVERVEGQERRRKQREACNRGKHANTVESAGRDVKGKPIRILTCTFCDNAWKASDPPWRKPKKAKEHA